MSSALQNYHHFNVLRPFFAQSSYHPLKTILGRQRNESDLWEVDQKQCVSLASGAPEQWAHQAMKRVAVEPTVFKVLDLLALHEEWEEFNLQSLDDLPTSQE